MKNLKTEYNDEENDDKKKYFYAGIQTTNVHYKSQSSSFDIFLDYAFRQKRNNFSKEKSKAKMQNYSYELEQTVVLNLELLQSFVNNSKLNNKKIIITNDNKSKDTAASTSSISPLSLIQLIKIIIEKAKKKAEISKNINKIIKTINNRIDENKNYALKIKEQKNKFKQKLSKTYFNMDNLDNYIIKMNKKFYNVQKHFENIIVNKKNKILNNNKNIFDIIYTNIDYNKKLKNAKNILQYYYNEVSDLKIDNELYNEEKKLYNNKENTNLIRCMEFYRRENYNLYISLKILRKRHKKIIEIMDFLNLGDIVQFSKQKNEEEANFEIEFSKINKGDNSLDLFSKMNKNINYSISFGD